MNSNWIGAISVTHKTIKFLGENHHDLGLGKEFSESTLKT